MNTQIKSMSRLLRATGGIAIAIALAGCAGANGSLDDVYHPATHWEKHPITVTKGMVKMQVPSHSSRMTSAHEDAVIRFAQQAKAHDAGTVYIKRPGGSVSADVVAGKVTQLMASEGVSTTAMKHSTYGGHGPVIVTYSRHFASTNECGDWSDDFAQSYQNDLPPNHGCAGQHNLAAMISNPKDLVTPRTMTNADAGRRAVVLEKYREGQPTASSSDGNDKVKVSDAVK